MTRRWRTGLKCESFMDTGPARFARGSERFSLRIHWWRSIRSKRRSAAGTRSRLWSCRNEEMETGNQKLENGELGIEACVVVVSSRCASFWFDILAAFQWATYSEVSRCEVRRCG